MQVYTVQRAAADDALPFTLPELRLHALAQTKLREVMVLDPGVRLHAAPDALFRNSAFQKAGVLFAPKGEFRARIGVWKLCGLTVPRHTAATGCFIMDRSQCWRALSLWRWIVDRTYFFNGYVDGDGGTAQLAFAATGQHAPLSRALRAFALSNNGTHQRDSFVVTHSHT